MEDIILKVSDLKTYLYTDEGTVPAVDGVSFELREKETLGVVGESGCGKSMLALSILRLIPVPPAKIIAGEVLFKGSNLIDKKESEMRKIRGNEISMIFQEPMTSLNPVHTVGNQISEVIRLHQGLSKKEAKEKSVQMLELVKISNPHHTINDYPHQLSGGMRQRVMIAMALACNPKVLIADEPTTALDVTIQAGILKLIRELKNKLGTSVILITHDLGVVAQVAKHVMVMYAGRVVEYADAKALFNYPKHPYSVGLLNSIPLLQKSVMELYTIKGTVPSVRDMPSGCKFSPRCNKRMEICSTKEPDLYCTPENSLVRCWLYKGDKPNEE